MHRRLLVLTASLITASFLIEITETLEFIIQPSDGKVVLSQSPSVTFWCRVDQSDLVIKPYWVLRFQELQCENELCYLSTDDTFDRSKLDQLKVEYKSDDASTIVTIPVFVKNNLTEIRCAAFHDGQTEFSEAVILSIVEGDTHTHTLVPSPSPHAVTVTQTQTQTVTVMPTPTQFPSPTIQEKSGSRLQTKNNSATHHTTKEAKVSHGTSKTNMVNLKIIVGVVSGCITVALLIAVITVAAVVIGMRWRKYRMKGSNTAAAAYYVAIQDTPAVSTTQNNSHHKKHSAKLQQQSDQVDAIPTAVISDQKSS